jgi:hypothetical protein
VEPPVLGPFLGGVRGFEAFECPMPNVPAERQSPPNVLDDNLTILFKSALAYPSGRVAAVPTPRRAQFFEAKSGTHRGHFGDMPIGVARRLTPNAAILAPIDPANLADWGPIREEIGSAKQCGAGAASAGHFLNNART